MESLLLTKVSCKASVQKAGVAINPKLNTELFYLKVILVNGMVEFLLEPGNRKLNISGNNKFPSRFKMSNLTKIDFGRAREGKLVLTLVNYNRSCPDFTEANLKPVMTLVYLSEASQDALNDLAAKLAAARLKRQRPDAEETQPEFDKKVDLAPKVEWTRMRRELLKLIMAFAGSEDGKTVPKMRLVSKKWNKAMSLLATKVRILDGSSCPGGIIARVMKRNPIVKRLSLENCANFGAREIKDSRSFPLRRVLELNLRGCKKLMNSAIFTMLQMCPDLQLLDLRDCDAADAELLTSINSRVHLLKLATLKLGRSFGEQCLPHLVSKFKQITSYTLDSIAFTEQAVHHLASAQLKELHCIINDVNVRRKVQAIEQPALERLTLVFDESFQSNYCVQCYRAFLNAPKLAYLHTNLDQSSLKPYLASYTLLEELKCVELPACIPQSLRKLQISTKGLSLLLELDNRTDVGLEGLDEMTIYTRDGNCASQISDKLKRQYPELSLRIIAQ